MKHIIVAGLLIFSTSFCAYCDIKEDLTKEAQMLISRKQEATKLIENINVRLCEIQGSFKLLNILEKEKQKAEKEEKTKESEKISQKEEESKENAKD